MSVRSSEPAGAAWGVGWLSGPSRATRVRGDEWLPREVTGKRSSWVGVACDSVGIIGSDIWSE